MMREPTGARLTSDAALSLFSGSGCWFAHERDRALVRLADYCLGDEASGWKPVLANLRAGHLSPPETCSAVDALLCNRGLEETAGPRRDSSSWSSISELSFGSSWVPATPGSHR
jgi:hypothetical protein